MDNICVAFIFQTLYVQGEKVYAKYKHHARPLSYYYPPDPRKTPKKQKPKIVASDNEVVPAASGSGFYITSSGYILTNNHVIEGCRKVTLSHKLNNHFNLLTPQDL